MEIKKLSNGYYVIVNENGKQLCDKKYYNALLFEYRKNALYVLKGIKKALPINLTFN
jgi:hypothetical protein